MKKSRFTPISLWPGKTSWKLGRGWSLGYAGSPR